MRHFGFEHFHVCAHDRGARVAHRLALDHPDAVERMMLLDIAPTLAMYENRSRVRDRVFPLVLPDPAGAAARDAGRRAYRCVHRARDGQPSAGLAPFAPGARATAPRSRSRAPCMRCEDYRASATIDLEHDRADLERGNKVACRCACCGENGIVGRCFDPLDEWRRVARDVSGRALECGHYIPEEAPVALIDELLAFFEARDAAAASWKPCEHAGGAHRVPARSAVRAVVLDERWQPARHWCRLHDRGARLGALRHFRQDVVEMRDRAQVEPADEAVVAGHLVALHEFGIRRSISSTRCSWPAASRGRSPAACSRARAGRVRR